METAQYEVKTLINRGPNIINDKDLVIWFNKKFINNTCKFLSPGPFSFTYVCHNYAFDNEGLDWYPAIKYLHKNYKQINISDIKKGDIITYRNSIELTHFGIIWQTDNTLQGTIIRSKWGNNGIFETDIYSVPESYGTIVKFWREK